MDGRALVWWDGGMRKRRYLAPWQRKDLMQEGSGASPRELSAEDLLALRGKPALYHCLSRVVNRDKLRVLVERRVFRQGMLTSLLISRKRLTQCIVRHSGIS